MAGAGLFLPPCRSRELRENCGSFASNRSVCVFESWNAASTARRRPDLLRGHNAACTEILLIPGSCLLQTTLLVCWSWSRGGQGWNTEQLVHWKGWGWQQVPLTLWIWGSRAEGRVQPPPEPVLRLPLGGLIHLGLGAGPLCRAPGLGKDEPGAVHFTLSD